MAKKKIIIDGAEYRYVVGSSYIRITDPTGHSKAISFEDFTGMSPDTIEKGIWKRWFAIRPGEVAAFISNGYQRPAAQQEA